MKINNKKTKQSVDVKSGQFDNDNSTIKSLLIQEKNAFNRGIFKE